MTAKILYGDHMHMPDMTPVSRRVVGLTTLNGTIYITYALRDLNYKFRIPIPANVYIRGLTL